MRKFKIFIFQIYILVKNTFPFCSGESLKETVTLEDRRIGERPEIIYHVIHTIFFGSLAMIIEG